MSDDCIEAFVNLASVQPDVDRGIRNAKGEFDCVRITHRNVMIRLNPTTVARAFLVVAENNMKESVIDVDGIKAIRAYLEESK